MSEITFGDVQSRENEEREAFRLNALDWKMTWTTKIYSETYMATLILINSDKPCC